MWRRAPGMRSRRRGVHSGAPVMSSAMAPGRNRCGTASAGGNISSSSSTTCSNAPGDGEPLVDHRHARETRCAAPRAAASTCSAGLAAAATAETVDVVASRGEIVGALVSDLLASWVGLEAQRQQADLSRQDELLSGTLTGEPGWSRPSRTSLAILNTDASVTPQPRSSDVADACQCAA